MQLDTFPLPDGWSAADVLEDAVVADGVRLLRAGLSSTGPMGEEITGAAVEADSSPVARGYYELLERVSTMEALHAPARSYDLLTAEGDLVGNRASADVFPESSDPSRWRYARSNGIALHSSWEQATLHAFWELAERDRVLRAWYGDTRPERIEFELDSCPLRSASSYEWRAYSFPNDRDTEFSRGVAVVGIYGVPRGSDLPLIFGYAARPERADARDAAVREAMQLLGFLWGEPLLDSLPAPTPTPLHHLEHFQWYDHRAILRRWLDEGHEVFRQREHAASGRAPSQQLTPVRFVDLTPSWLGGGLRVAKAICDAAKPLVFGESPFITHLPRDRRTHPIG